MKRTVVIEYDDRALSGAEIEAIVNRRVATVTLPPRFTTEDIETVLRPMLDDIHALLGHIFATDPDWSRR